MSYDRVYVCPSADKKTWLRSHPTQEQNMEEFYREWDRLYKKGDLVVLSAGMHLFDELFLFENSRDAQLFYEDGYRAWECFLVDEEEGCGFQEVSLYLNGRHAAFKNSPPTNWSDTRGNPDVGTAEPAV